jgi:trk system potassium uptake protein TrkA
MHIIIIGCGRIGSQLARDLSESGADVAVVDRDGTRLNALGSGFNGQVIKGIEFDTDILKKAGIDKADLVLPVTPDDNVNITVSMVAKRLFNVPRVISRVCSPDKKYVYEKLELETINPTQLGVDLLIAKIGEIKE